MALQTRLTSTTVTPALRPTPRQANPIALHPARLLREVTGDSPGTETLCVRGNAMRDALLADGDTVLLQRSDQLAEGDFVVLRLAGSPKLRLRRIHFEGDSLRLQPESPRYPAEMASPAEVRVRGRVIAIMRQPR